MVAERKVVIAGYKPVEVIRIANLEWLVAARCIDQDVGDCRKPQTAADWPPSWPGGAIGPQLELLADAALGGQFAGDLTSP